MLAIEMEMHERCIDCQLNTIARKPRYMAIVHDKSNRPHPLRHRAEAGD